MVELSEQQERFCRNIVEGMSQGEAYVAAGYKAANDATARASASRLLTNANVASRIAELREPIAAKFEITTDFIAQELLNVWRASLKAEDRTNARQSLMDIAKLTGRIVDVSKVQAENVNYNISDEPLTDDEWADSYGAGDALAPAAGSSTRSH